MFVKEMVSKAQAQMALKKKLRLKKLKYLEETKGADAEKNDSDSEREEELTYPEECRVLDIMKEKYYEAVQFFRDTDDKKQTALAVKEYQRFCYFYEKMSRFLEFDPA